MGASFPGEPEVPSTLNCETDLTNPILGDSVFLLTGDTDIIFDGMDLSFGDVRISFPVRAINEESGEIVCNDDTMKDIRIVDSGDEGRRLTVETIGDKYILVIRVSGFSNGERQEVNHSRSQLDNDIFNWNNNNLVSFLHSCVCIVKTSLRKFNIILTPDTHNLEQKSLYKGCSAGKLKIKPAIGPNAVDGIIDVEISSNKDICSMNYLSVGNAALRDGNIAGFYAGATRQITNKMIVLPDCVSFNGAAAWGQVSKTTTWFQSRTVSFPATQVHELGHNFGMRHSGKNSDEYADATGYMSNRMAWDEEGNKMCFNAAKMWYFGWYSDEHKSIEPSNDERTFDLIALDDIKNEKEFAEDAVSVLELVGGEGGSNNLYVMFNRAKGMNVEVPADKNKVVIIEQSGPAQTSYWKGALDPNGVVTYSQANWGEEGETLVIKIESVNYGQNFDEADFARIRVYVDSAFHNELPGGSPSDAGPVCEDVEGWHDSDGAMYNCAWYAGGTNCANYGNGYENDGQTANTACCACKVASGTVDPENSAIANPSNITVQSKPSTGDNNDALCEDDASWYDQQGAEYDCEWYGEDLNRCNILGGGYENFGKTAKDACCICMVQ